MSVSFRRTTSIASVHPKRWYLRAHSPLPEHKLRHSIFISLAAVSASPISAEHFVVLRALKSDDLGLVALLKLNLCLLRVELVKVRAQRVTEAPDVAVGVQGGPGVAAGILFAGFQHHEERVEAVCDSVGVLVLQRELGFVT